MKHFNTLIFVLFFITSFSCQKEEFDADNIQEVLVGQWHQEPWAYNSLMINEEFTFKRDYTFERINTVVDSSGNLLGFLEKATGNYEIKKGKITMNYVQFFQYKDALTGTSWYGDAASLVSYTPVVPSIYKNIVIKINQDKKSLSLDFPPCPYNVHCKSDYQPILFKN